MWHVSIKKLERLLAGMMDESMEFKTCNMRYAQTIRYLFLRIGVLLTSTVHEVLEDDKIYHRRQQQVGEKIYQLYVPLDNRLKTIIDFNWGTVDVIKSGINALNYFVCDKMVYTRIVSIVEEEYTGPVYDFNMNWNHNYMTECGLVHNSGKRPGAFAI